MIVIENGDILAPELQGVQTLLLSFGKIHSIGEVDLQAVEKLDPSFLRINAKDCWVLPGLIDPHEHLIGGSGESGFSSQTPSVTLRELVRAGVTTVVGCLGSDTITKTMANLVAQIKALREQGLTAYCYTGGYEVPPRTLTHDIRTYLLFIQEIIGTGEVAIFDERSSDPDLQHLARIVSDTYVAGQLSHKAGITHFHVGDEDDMLKPLFQLMDDYAIGIENLYPTHVNRSERLVKDAARFHKKGGVVDFDTTDEDLGKKLLLFLNSGGTLERVTVSTDTAKNSPDALFLQICECVTKYKFSFNEILPLVTSNTAKTLKLSSKGNLARNKDADLLIVDKKDFALTTVISGGKIMMKNGTIAVEENEERESRRLFYHEGRKRRSG